MGQFDDYRPQSFVTNDALPKLLELYKIEFYALYVHTHHMEYQIVNQLLFPHHNDQETVPMEII